MKDLGINAVLLLPAYEFCEVDENDRAEQELQPVFGLEENPPEKKINYWGYGTKDSFYFAPKASYSSQANPSLEFKEMVQAFHANGIEVLLDIYFAPGTNLFLMTDCLRSWVLKYHVDGFRINQEVMPSLTVASDPILSGVKILASYWDMEALHGAGISGQKNALGEFNEGFKNEARRFLKGDEGMVERMVKYFSRNSEEHSVVNFMTSVNGFTMMDLVSYDVKHNQDNGEMNSDGTEFNYSWNCGVEGKTRKKSIMDRRMIQIRNAFLMLLTSQGTPMILAGDELGNTQFGNNNAYCQDNAVTWINWNMTQTAGQIHDFVKHIIQFRKAFCVLHQEQKLHMIDTLSCGMPDLSVHGTQAWRPDFSNYSRMLGLLYYGEYVEERNGRSVYIIYNMYWEAKSFDLPNLPKGRNWKVMIDTYDNTFDGTLLKAKKVSAKKSMRKAKKQVELQKKTVVPPRTIVVFVEEDA
jgi:glycogen operon protein